MTITETLTTSASLEDTTRPRGALIAAIRSLRPGLGEIRDQDELAALGLDSLDRVALANTVEQATGLPVCDQALADARTVADLLTSTTDVTVPVPASPLEFEQAPRSAPAPSRAPASGLGWVDPGGQAGTGTRLWHQAQIASNAHVGADCTLGKGAYVGSGCRVGDRVKIGNNAQLFGADIADEVMICPGALLLEDPSPRATTPDGRRKSHGDFVSRPVTVRTGATIGAGAILTPGVTIGAHALVTAGAVVSHDVAAHALVAGNPARHCGWVCRCGITLLADHQCPSCNRRYRMHDGHLIAAEDPAETRSPDLAGIFPQPLLAGS